MTILELMKRLVRGLLALWITTFVFMFSIDHAVATPAPAPEGCVINVLGIKVCGTLIGQPLPEIVTVTADPIVIPGPTVTLPPVTVTVRPDPIRIPGPTVTVTDRVPIGAPTVTLPPLPQATKTVTVRPPGTPTKTVTETVTPQTPGPTAGPVNPEPTATVTETVEVESPTGQTVSPSDTVEPNDKPDQDFLSPSIDFDDGTVTAGEAGLGLLGAFFMLALIVGGMLYGFRRGLRSEQGVEADFLRTMLDRSKTT